MTFRNPTPREEFYRQIRAAYPGCDISFTFDGPILVTVVLPEWCIESQADTVRDDLTQRLECACIAFLPPVVSIERGPRE
jgi:hypothetical protein